MKPTQRKRRGSEQLLAGALSGAVATSLTAPLDLAKTILQSNGAKRSTVNILCDVVKREGSRAVFKGLGPSLAGIIPQWAIYFQTYDFLKKSLESEGYTQTTASVSAAFASGSISTILTNPIWVVKTRMQVSKAKYVGMKTSIRSILSREGIRGFYKGTAASLIGVSHIGIQFPLYEKLKKNQNIGDLGMSGLMIASSVSKVLASAATYPHEVIRTRMQCDVHQSRGLFESTRQILRSEGINVLYRGMAPNMVRSLPASVITFTVYESAFKYLTNES